MKKGLFNRLRRGQTMVFLVMVVVILAFIALWNFDLHKVIYIKTITRNAGDGAALAAARWQGITLNILGELNAAQAVSINDSLLRGDTNFAEARAIADLQARVCFAGPMIGFASAQQAGKNNGIHANSAFTAQVVGHAAAVRAYAAAAKSQGVRPPYVNSDGSTAWDDYADMLSVIGGEGIVAMPGRASPYSGYHILLDRDFYQAIATMNWCWFYNHARTLLQTYGGWQTWPPLPSFLTSAFNASEYFPINVTTVPYLASLAGYTGDLSVPGKVLQQLSQISSHSLVTDVELVPATWYCYDRSHWMPWSEWINTNNNDSSGPFPFLSSIKKQYDVAGCDAGLAVLADSSPTLFSKKQYAITWVAAAKPFGYLDGDVLPNTYGIVLPAFRDVRLIPYDAKISPDGGTPDDLVWIEHITAHLPVYMKYGPDGIRDLAAHCMYCSDLIRWEDPNFRMTGVLWLQTYSTNCIVPKGGGGGGSSGGGSSHGH